MNEIEDLKSDIKSLEDKVEDLEGTVEELEISLDIIGKHFLSHYHRQGGNLLGGSPITTGGPIIPQIEEAKRRKAERKKIKNMTPEEKEIRKITDKIIENTFGD